MQVPGVGPYSEGMKLRTDGISWQEIDGELVILDLNSSKYMTTNATGAFLAKLLVEEQSTEQLAAALVDAYGIDLAVAERSVGTFVTALRDKDLLIIS